MTILPEPFKNNYSSLLGDQRKAVDDTGRNILISASAGTGKSFVLVNRLLKRIINRELEIDEVVVMTFTRDAAAELQVKMMKELLKNRDRSDDPEMKDYLNRQIAKLPSATISTIHSFCYDIVKKYGYILDKDPLSLGNVMDDSDTAMLEQQTLDIITNEIISRPQLVACFCERSESLDPLIRKIKALIKKRNSLPDYQDWKKKVFEIYDQIEKGIIPDSFERIIREHFRTRIKDASAYCSVLRDFYDNNAYGEENWIKNPVKNITPDRHIGQYEDFYQQTLDNIDSLSAAEIINSLVEFKKQVKNFPSIKDLDKETKDAFGKLKDNVTEPFDNIKKMPLLVPELITVCQRSRPVLEELFTVSELYYDTLNELKDKAGLISFDDMGTMAIRILQHREIADEIRNRYKEILVDEYQDSSAEQEELVQLIANGNNVFRVGDIKQAIYGFRGTKPEIMKNLIDNRTENDELLHLKVNFRSGNNILRFSNYLFRYLMNVTADNIYVPQLDDLELAEKNRKYTDTVHLRQVEMDKDSTLSEKRERLCRFIASDIYELVQNGSYKYGDFMILVRNNRHKRMLKNTFARYGIPAIASFKRGFFSDAAVSTVVSLLNLLLVPDNQLHILNILRGPLYNLSDEQIAAYIHEHGPVSLDEECTVTSSLQQLMTKLQNCTSLNDIILTIFRERNFYLDLISRQQRDNLDSLFAMVIAFQKNQTGIANLLNYLEKQKYTDKEEATSLSSQDDAVQIMTIHQSKGLSRPYVYVVDFNNAARGRNDDFCDDELGAGIDFVYLPENVRRKNPLVTYFIKNRNKTADLDEEIRLLYVALTRAERHLDVVYFESKTDEKLTVSGLSSNTYIGWIQTVMNCHPDTDSNEYVTVDKPVTDFTELPDNLGQASSGNITVLPETEKQRQAETQIAHETDHSTVYPLDYDRPSAALRGTVMHRAVELLGIREITADDINHLDLPLSRWDIQKIISFCNHPLTVSLRNNENHHEYPYISVKDGIPANGIIDLLSVGAKKIYIIDFKSDRNVTAEILKERYTQQLSVYHETVARRYGDREIITCIYSFRLNDYVLLNID